MLLKRIYKERKSKERESIERENSRREIIGKENMRRVKILDIEEEHISS